MAGGEMLTGGQCTGEPFGRGEQLAVEVAAAG